MAYYFLLQILLSTICIYDRYLGVSGCFGRAGKKHLFVFLPALPLPPPIGLLLPWKAVHPGRWAAIFMNRKARQHKVQVLLSRKLKWSYLLPYCPPTDKPEWEAAPTESTILHECFAGTEKNSLQGIRFKLILYVKWGENRYWLLLLLYLFVMCKNDTFNMNLLGNKTV